MKKNIFMLFAVLLLPIYLLGQTVVLIPGKPIERKLLKGENHSYTISLKKGEFLECVVMQKGVDLAIDVVDPLGKKMKTLDSPNGSVGPEPVLIEALKSGKFLLHIYPILGDQSELSDSLKLIIAEENQGDYTITDINKMSSNEYKNKLAKIQDDKNLFTKWIKDNTYEIKTVDAGNGFEDLQSFKSVLKDVRVVGLGEATHGTSEFFRMKHRMLEFLVKEMSFTSFYIEASMGRCRYINEYVLIGKGDLDTATAIQGFTPWRVEEVRNMISWVRQYNLNVPQEKKVKFLGYDLQINDQGWKSLKDFYLTVNYQKLANLDSIKMLADTAAKYVQTTDYSRQKKGALLYNNVYQKCLAVMNDIVLNEGKYEYLTSKNIYTENLMNIKLIVEEVETYKDFSIASTIRDYYMAQNILYLLNHENPETKVVVWAHNMHIAKSKTDYFKSMGSNLADVLKNDYYSIGFEFYSGSFLTRNMDIKNNKSKIWDVMSVGTPPEGSLPWYYNKSGKDNFYIDFRNTGTDKIKNFSLPYEMHLFGSTYSTEWPITYQSSLTYYDGMIYIKESKAAKSFSNVIISR